MENGSRETDSGNGKGNPPVILYKFPERLPLLLVFWVVPGEENDTESLPGSTALGGTEAVEHLLAGETRQSQEQVVLDHVDNGLCR